MKPAVGPIALDYLAQQLAASGFQPEVLDLCFEDDPLDAIQKRLAGGEVTAVGLTVRNTDDCYFTGRDFFLPDYRDLVRYLRQTTGVPVVVGGVGFSSAPKAALDYLEADWGIAGEGEEALPELLGCLRRGEDPAGIPGLVYRSWEGMECNPTRSISLDWLVLSRREHVDNGRYFREGGQGGIETKRGCDGRCIYCADPVSKGREIRCRDPEDVADEAENLLGQGVDCLHMCDSEFNRPPEHALAISEAFIRRGLGERIRWYAYACPTGFDRELARTMRWAGCVGINFGVDSGCDSILSRLGRDFTVEDVKRTASLCREAGIACMYDLLIGGPGETRDTVAETISFMKRVGPDRVGAAVGIRLYPGTALGERIKKEGLSSHDANLHGNVEENQSLMQPIFYLSEELGTDVLEYVGGLVAGDERFFFAQEDAGDRNYDYNDNAVLTEAIRRGHRGAYWDILRKLQGEIGG
jgi:radical SAM superfamily enzyme YgiQ (UPF0313 family)